MPKVELNFWGSLPHECDLKIDGKDVPFITDISVKSDAENWTELLVTKLRHDENGKPVINYDKDDFIVDTYDVFSDDLTGMYGEKETPYHFVS